MTDRDELKELIRQRTDLVELVGERVELRKAGREYRARCPFHEERTPSFYVVPQKGFYKCFGCGESGDVFSFLMRTRGLDFRGALELLGSRAGIEVPRGRTPPPPSTWTPPPPKKVAYRASGAVEIDADTLKRRQDILGELLYGVGLGIEGPAKGYLESRAFDPAELEAFGVRSIAPDAWSSIELRLREYGPEWRKASGIFDEADRLAPPWGGRFELVVLPYFLHRGDQGPSALRFRELSDEHGKYRNLLGTGAPKFAFNAPSLEGEVETVVLCEGEFDALTFATRGHTALALGGTSLVALPWFVERLDPAWRVEVCVDRDENKAGESAGRKIVAALQEKLGKAWVQSNVSMLLPRVGKDANELAMRQRKENP